MQVASSNYPDISSQFVTSKPPPALPSPSEPTSSSRRHLYMTSVTDSPMLMRTSRRDTSGSSGSDRFNYYERWQPPNGAGHHAASASAATSSYSSPYLSRMTSTTSAPSTSAAAASSTTSPYSGSYGSPLHYGHRYHQHQDDVTSQASSTAAAKSAAKAT